jgi:hypothetical protein
MFYQSHVLPKSCSIKVYQSPIFLSVFYQSHVLPKSCSTKVMFYQSHVLPKSCSTKVLFYQSQAYSKIGFQQGPFYQSHILSKSCSTKVMFYQSHVLPKSILLKSGSAEMNSTKVRFASKVRFYQIIFYQSPLPRHAVGEVTAIMWREMFFCTQPDRTGKLLLMR